MQSRQGNRLQSLRAVEEFLSANAAVLDEVVNTGTRKQLAAMLAALDIIVTEQAGSSVIAQGGTRRYRALRQALVRDHMAPIARIARAELPATPGMDALRMPKHNWSAERLAAAAHGMAQAAAPFAADFVTAGLRGDFIARLTAAADAMVQSLSDRAQTRGRLTGATKGLATSLASARKLVDVIDALVRSALLDDPALLASWKHVKRVRRVASRAGADVETGAPAVVLPPDAQGPTTGIRSMRERFGMSGASHTRRSSHVGGADAPGGRRRDQCVAPAALAPMPFSSATIGGDSAS